MRHDKMFLPHRNLYQSQECAHKYTVKNGATLLLVHSLEAEMSHLSPAVILNVCVIFPRPRHCF